MPESNHADVHESPDERMQRRRARRWKRRARIVGPFLGIPLLLGTLALSVDLIEYQPQKPKNRLSDRPIPETVVAVEQRQQQRAIPVSTSVATASVMTASPALNAAPGAALDLSLVSGDEDAATERTREFAPPQPPYATRGQR